MTTIHLGVFDVPYVDAKGITTGDVAEILEAKYHVMEVFAEVHAEDIAASLANAVEGSIETLLMGGSFQAVQASMLGGLSDVDDKFKQFLSQGEMERLGYPGVPTKAALDRQSSRFKKKRGPNRRPSFIDTGQYQASFHSWVDNE